MLIMVLIHHSAGLSELRVMFIVFINTFILHKCAPPEVNSPEGRVFS